MKTYILTIVVLILNGHLSFSQHQQNALPENNTAFAYWLKKYIPENYKNATFDHHNDWFQVNLPEHKLTISWGKVTSTQSELREVEGLTENESLFIGRQKEENWTDLPGIEYYPEMGYYITQYKEATMGSFKVRPLTVLQFDGDSKNFIDELVNAFSRTSSVSEHDFMYWVKDYINNIYPSQKVAYHGAWYQSVIPQLDLTVTWGTMDKQQMVIKDLYGVREDKSFFIEKNSVEDWNKFPTITHKQGLGYYLSTYNAPTMGNFEVGNSCVIQFNGNANAFVDQMYQAWQASAHFYQHNGSEPTAGIGYQPFPKNVRVTKVKHFDNMCWKIAAAGGTWYFENGETDGKTGFSSAFDQAGNDWIGNDADKGYNTSSSNGGKHEYRGWPNFGEGNFNHPQRKSNATSYWTDAKGNPIAFNHILEGDHLIMRTSNETYDLEYHFYPTHATIKIIKAKDNYAFLYEGPVGGEQEAPIEKDYYVLKDGVHRTFVEGGLGYLNPEFGNKFPSPYFYLADSDPKDTQVFYVGVKDTGPTAAGDEGWRQGDNMVIFSFGRDEDKRAYTGNEAICVFGFYPKGPHDQISTFIESRLKQPFTPVMKTD
ncbi:hypothetical protein SAMN04488009_2320 [Maribacter sedimenticola]|uniref:DKNYY family protein n=1 Tax=Maribacter sedimenticola TaxID=228956 RepID=A0ABY1SIN1_9FLAO|nr:hypothetical protein [Maribacter sedimenticola]SNR54867.1 hypothetical protein SAMN04488009_2320 [Maribacter sedimenticola]